MPCIGRASDESIRRIEAISAKPYPRTGPEILVADLDLKLSGVPRGRKKSEAIAKLITALKEGPLREWKDTSKFYEKAEVFLKTRESEDWSK
jgi:hypothetical protein